MLRTGRIPLQICDNPKLEGIELGQALLLLVLARRLFALVEARVGLLWPRSLCGRLRTRRNIIHLVRSSGGFLDGGYSIRVWRSNCLESAIVVGGGFGRG